MLAATPQISAVVLNKFFISVRVESQRILWKKSELQVKRFNHTWIYARENCSILNISYFRVCSHFSIIAFVAIHDKTNLLAVTPENSLHKFADGYLEWSTQPATPVSHTCWRASMHQASQGNSLFLSLWTSAALCQRDLLTWNNLLSTPPFIDCSPVPSSLTPPPR